MMLSSRAVSSRAMIGRGRSIVPASRGTSALAVASPSRPIDRCRAPRGCVAQALGMAREKWEAVAAPVHKQEKDGVRLTPSMEHLEIWRTADAVCFDVDCTCVKNDGLDVLAEFMGVAKEVEELTNKAMDETMDLDEALAERLKIINCTPADVKRFLKQHPPESRINPGIKKLISSLMARGIHVYLISGGFREIMLPVAKYLGVPYGNVFANRMNWQWDDETGEPTKLVGFDLSEPTARNQGKPEAIAQLRKNFPYNSIVMIGDGITDLEAVQFSGGADLFIGYGYNVARPTVMAQADWFVYDFDVLTSALKRSKIAMVGSGAWACAAMHMISQSVLQENSNENLYGVFDQEIKMWVFEEDYKGQKLTDVINEKNENPKYLPGVALGSNVTAVPDLVSAVFDADILVICAPHQFVHGICKKMMGKIKENAIAISLTKGMRVRPDGPQLISQMISKNLNIDCSVLMGANVATNIGDEELSEATIGYYKLENAKIFKKMFERDYFHVTLIPDAPGAEMCGTLKNIVALAAGMIDGLGLGSNSKAAIMRQGLSEMRKLAKALYPAIRDETFMESCGVADLIATCIGGRNRLCAEKWVQELLAGSPRSFEELEVELLDGQKLQGTLTTMEVYAIIAERGWELEYPLFTTTYRVIKGQLHPEMIGNYLQGARQNVGVVEEEGPVAKVNPFPTMDV
uniref:Glycerol-3-phosphate dehydrogenase [NAD(+)] n=1 Tax=Chlamydomonas sp. ICE-MDV TaxID=1983280 RepID=A0A7D7L907_9CHLO|nr:Phosphoserine phosphatase-glycerol-3-phosphate dehydrogenase isoform 2 [Chlamydomonas sp. ICE-MDV]|eukprot:gene21038-27908_t